MALAFHLGGLLQHPFKTTSRDFIEMGLHHAVTVSLIAGVYMANFYHTGAMVSILHDSGDILVCVSRVLSEGGDKIFVPFVFVANMFIWAWTRMMCLPYLIYTYHHIELQVGKDLKFYFIWFHSVLIVLHYYWFGLFAKMLLKFA